jgi:translation initiation factor IF-2
MTDSIQQVSLVRPPIIVVLGHVDHGKTSLLDYIRKSSIAKREKGGITQGIGASVIHTKEGKDLTFIDTPGHAAFSKMRSRGAKVADIAILIVAGDDGVKPQTKEALERILAEGMPYIVAVTKIDLPTSSLESIQSQLEQLGVLFEGRGGDTPCVGVSSMTGVGVDELLEVINLVSEMKNISGDPKSPLEAVVIETTKDKRGLSSSIVIRNGTISVGDDIVSDTVKGRVKALYSDAGVQIKQAFPGYPVSVLGFESLPSVGSQVWNVVHGAPIGLATVTDNKRLSVVDTEGMITLVIKAQNQGALEAIIASLPTDTFVLSSGVGDINESDVFIAKSGKAKIFAFESKIPSTVVTLAKTEAVVIEQFGIIYELIDRVEELINGGKDEILGKAEVLAKFPFDARQVAGCKVMSGKITKGDKVIMMRKEKPLGEVKVISVRRGKSDIPEAKQGEECGIIFVPQLDFTIGDVVLSIRRK